MKRCGKCPTCLRLEGAKAVMFRTVLGHYEGAVYVPGLLSEKDRNWWNREVLNNPCENPVENNQ